MKLAAAAARRFLDKPDAQVRGALLYGPNRALVAEAAAQLARHALGGSDDPFAITKLNDDDLRKDKARVSDALSAQSLLGGPTLVWARIENESGAEAILFALSDIEAERPGGFLLIEGGELSNSGKLAKAFEGAKRAVAAAFYEESEADLAAFADTLIAQMKIPLDAEARETLLALLPPDRGLMRREIEKLAAFAHGAASPIAGAEVETLIADAGEGALDAAALAALQGKAADSTETLSRIDALQGVSAIKAMERRLLRLLEARAHIDSGASPPDAMAKLKPPIFWKERDAFLAQLRAWTTRRLVTALDLMWAAEMRAKQAQSPQELIAADAYRAVANLIKR